MKKKLLFLLRYYLFWLVLSVVAKFLFLVYQGGEAFSLSFIDYVQIFYRGLQIDLSFGGYMVMLASLLLALTPFLAEHIVRRVFSVLTALLLVICAIIITIDLELFKNWGYHLDATPLLYIKTPKEAMASTPDGLIAALIALMCVFAGLFYYLFRKFVMPELHYKKGPWWQAVIFLMIGGAMIVPVRGGFNVAPMNSSFVFFHRTSMFANQAAVNPVWNFIYEMMHIDKRSNDYHFMEQEKAEQLVDSLYHTNDTYPRLLTVQRPNVVILLLESFTANAIEALGGEKGVTPNLNRLAKEGVLFSNIYASGNRSDRGLVSVISAYPAHPDLSLIKYPNKTVTRPRIPKDFEANGYHTRFYYAGDINFGSFRSYVTMSFQDMVTEDDFSGKAKEERFKWGVHDEFMFERLYEDVSRAPQPFMYMAFNMSSHEPFEVPMDTRIEGEGKDKKLMNAIYYSDSCIGNFMTKCKQSGLWDNTLFVLVADHGTRVIGNLSPNAPEAYRIPLILTGGVLNVRDTIIHTIGSQTDVAATLLAQLGMDHSAYKYSKNLLAGELIPFAFYAYSNASGIVTEEGVTIYDLKSRHYLAGDSLTRNGELLKACLQVLNQDIN